MMSMPTTRPFGDVRSAATCGNSQHAYVVLLDGIDRFTCDQEPGAYPLIRQRDASNRYRETYEINNSLSVPKQFVFLVDLDL